MCFSSAEGTSDFRRGWLLKRALKWKTVLAMQQPEAARHFFVCSFGRASASSSFIPIQSYDLLPLPTTRSWNELVNIIESMEFSPPKCANCIIREYPQLHIHISPPETPPNCPHMTAFSYCAPQSSQKLHSMVYPVLPCRSSSICLNDCCTWFEFL
jgi:hypothetical protein